MGRLFAFFAGMLPFQLALFPDDGVEQVRINGLEEMVLEPILSGLFDVVRV